MDSDSSKDKKQEANELGKFAEEIATREYIKEGYAILERNWRLGKTEIDIIAQKGDVIAFIEVKARKDNLQDAIEAVSHDKRKRMAKAADTYIRALKGDFEYRFDFFGLAGNREKYTIEKLEDAFLAADFF